MVCDVLSQDWCEVTFAEDEVKGDRNGSGIVTDSQFFTTEERDGMINSGMAEGMNQSYAVLDKLLASIR